MAAYIHICLYSAFKMMDCEEKCDFFILTIIVEINFFTQIFL